MIIVGREEEEEVEQTTRNTRTLVSSCNIGGCHRSVHWRGYRIGGSGGGVGMGRVGMRG